LCELLHEVGKYGVQEPVKFLRPKLGSGGFDFFNDVTFITTGLDPLSEIIAACNKRREEVLIDSAKNFANIQIELMAGIF